MKSKDGGEKDSPIRSKGRRGFVLPQKGDSKKVKISKVAALVAVAAIIAAVIFFGYLIHKYVSKDMELNKVKTYYSSSDVSDRKETGSSPEAKKVWQDTSVEMDPDYGISKDFVKLYKTNPDVVGYLKIPGTKLDMPVVHGTNNSYYLNHNIEKKYNPFGIPFLDYRDILKDDNESEILTIYGHAAKDGTFFAPVKEYKSFDFYKKHPTLTFNTIYGKRLYQVIALMMVDTDVTQKDVFDYHDYYDIKSSDMFNYFMDQVNRRSYFHTGVDVMYGDQILTLSTCDTEVIDSNQTPYRIALVARKVQAGEEMDVDVSKASINKEVVMPDGWIKKYGKKTPFEK